MNYDPTLLDDARAILEGHHAFQHRLPCQISAYKKLSSLARHTSGGKIILVNGEPGCGVTTLLDLLQFEMKSTALTLECDFFTTSVTLIDRVCASVLSISDYDYHQKVPVWLYEYAALTGLKVIIIDDIDRFVFTSYELQTLVAYMEELVGPRSGLTIAFSTRDKKIVRRFLKLPPSVRCEVWVDGCLSSEELSELWADFFEWNNSRLGLNLHWRDALPRKIAKDNQIDYLIKDVEVAYVSKMLETGFQNGESEHSFSKGEARYELERILYG